MQLFKSIYLLIVFSISGFLFFCCTDEASQNIDLGGVSNEGVSDTITNLTDDYFYNDISETGTADNETEADIYSVDSVSDSGYGIDDEILYPDVFIVDIDTDISDTSDLSDTGSISPNRGFPSGFPWVSFYGSAENIDLNRVAQYFRIINIDVDPDIGNFTDDQIKLLKNGGKNRVISYLNVGSCENWRSYYKNNPPGFKSCVSTGALTTVYSTEYPDEKWADLSNKDYQNLIINYVAKRLADRGVDGFFLDNMEVVEHGPDAKYGPCDSKCSQGGLDLVYKLREKFPDKLIVMQNATSDITLNGYTNGIWYPLLLDGISHEEVYSNGGDAEALSQMKKWRDKKIFVNGFPFWLGVEEYVGKCDSAHKSEALSLYNKATSDGFNAYVTDESSVQQSPCYWE